MKVVELFKELKETEGYGEFISENPSAYLSAGFFILDLENRTEQIQLDFYLPKEKKMAAFEFPFKAAKIFDEEMKEIVPLSLDLKFDIDDLKDVCKEIIKKNGSGMVLNKIIAILKEGQWNLTCMDNMMGIVRIKLNSVTGEEISFDKGSLMDFMGIKKG
ncbi:MAG: hypothetical protein NUV97_04205 [archaeon]|nr:hypothetical protein [archaeon]MCR4323547.1 hypothetical protein [Nanoarchaeota archaeon]